jgi:hypothetical protein
MTTDIPQDQELVQQYVWVVIERYDYLSYDKLPTLRVFASADDASRVASEHPYFDVYWRPLE